ncbi:MAG: HNH endonuclease [Pseudomonadota bacterium]|nr:HNH endonuclease [Pseudomonadota bacterium]
MKSVRHLPKATTSDGLWLFVARKTALAKTPSLQEGKRFSVTSTAIERSPAARETCLAHYGYKYECEACGFNFERAYGEHGKNYIHVHHRIELASSEGPIYTDPAKDLIPLCPNCHAMVHRGKGTMSVEELQRIINENKAQRERSTAKA